VACALLVAVLVASCMRRFWNLAGLLWPGGWRWRLLRADEGRRRRPERGETDRWGGLPLTVMLATLSILVIRSRWRWWWRWGGVAAAGDPHAVRAVRRADPRRAADQRAVHGQLHPARCSCPGHAWTCCCAC
jgi:hypothetical protein